MLPAALPGRSQACARGLPGFVNYSPASCATFLCTLPSHQPVARPDKTNMDMQRRRVIMPPTMGAAMAFITQIRHRRPRGIGNRRR